MTDRALRSFATLQRGDVVPPFPLIISSEDVHAYLAATGEDGARWATTVPPLAVGAFMLAGLMERVEVPASTVHTGQEYEFRRAVVHGEPLEVVIVVGARSERRGAVILALDGTWRSGGEEFGTSRTTVLAALPGEATP